MWTDPVMKFIDVNNDPRRIIGIAADVDDENVVPGPAMTVYHPFQQEIGGGRLFVHTRGDPYALVPSITRVIRDLSPDQPVEQAATLDDVRAEVLAPDRLNALVFGGFAAVALPIAVVGVAGVLAFSVSARTREFGIRLAIGSAPRHLLTRVLSEGAVIAVAGIVAGAVGGLALAKAGEQLCSRRSRFPGLLPIAGAASDSRRRGDRRVADASRARVAGGCHQGAAGGLTGAGTLEQQLALAGVAGQRGGALELVARLLRAADLDEQVAAHARQEMIALERRLGGQRIDEVEAGCGTDGHRYRDGAVQLDDRRRRECTSCS